MFVRLSSRLSANVLCCPSMDCGVAAFWGGLAIALGLAGCAPQGEGLADKDAAFKIPAMKAAVQSGDRRALGPLVQSLDSEDPAVRLYAIESLQRLTGMSFDYHYYDDAATRKPAVDRWKAWLVEHHY